MHRWAADAGQAPADTDARRWTMRSIGKATSRIHTRHFARLAALSHAAEAPEEPSQ